MAKKIRFALKMENEIEVRTLSELQDNFSLTKVLEYVSNGKLVTWLRDRYLDATADVIEKLDLNNSELPKQVCELFDINNVAFCQDDLYDLLDEQYDMIYLYGDKFEIPLDKKDVTYIGFNNPVVVVINAKEEINLKERNINLLKVQINNKNLSKYKKTAVSTTNDHVITLESQKASVELDETSSIIIDEPEIVIAATDICSIVRETLVILYGWNDTNDTDKDLCQYISLIINKYKERNAPIVIRNTSLWIEPGALFLLLRNSEAISFLKNAITLEPQDASVKSGETGFITIDGPVTTTADITRVVTATLDILCGYNITDKNLFQYINGIIRELRPKTTLFYKSSWYTMLPCKVDIIIYDSEGEYTDSTVIEGDEFISYCKDFGIEEPHMLLELLRNPKVISLLENEDSERTLFNFLG